ncbi:thioredoxin-dependent thiol peroxidase [Anoxybacillus kestanbolensis]|uniref:thioredoxin-dependent thiol peroxidase n=1 Tax=Anoxybacillus kestanbolensis TaxID=227476 RepID=UPI003D20DE63
MKAPDFTLPASNGEHVTLSQFRGKYVVLYFYPKDMTPGCTTEACEFRDHYEAFNELGAVVIGISSDSLERHNKFIEKHSLPFLLLSDEKQDVAKAYNVWKLKKNFGKEYMGIERSTFLIDPNGHIVKEWRKVKVNGHVEEVLDALKQAIGSNK